MPLRDVRGRYDVAIPRLVAMMTPFQQLRTKYRLNASLSLGDTFNRAALRCDICLLLDGHM